MSELMRPLPFDKLMKWALHEWQTKQRIFGVEQAHFYCSDAGGVQLLGQQLASAIGPAAGPHSQLAQNIVAAWLCGSRFIELKTVQKMDGEELSACVPRPCINAADEGYNVEWSTELTVPAALNEYIKAWVAIHALSAELGIPQGTPLIFNASVGYDLDGIKSPKLDNFIESLKDASSTTQFNDSVNWLKQNLSLFSNLSEDDVAAIPPSVSNSVTLSTLHGCPPDEIERIARYLLSEKKLHTYVKCNPTLLGYANVRSLLDSLGYGYVKFTEHHFNNDLQYSDAVEMFKRLLGLSGSLQLAFGLKLTNTFPVHTEGLLPGDEMYMSGRALAPLTISLAAKLAESFGGALPISYSGGADAWNIKQIYATGIRPITVATTLLKPGGYERLFQLAELLCGMPDVHSGSSPISTSALQQLAAELTSNPHYQKHTLGSPDKTQLELGLYDCFVAPCQSGGCQQVPQYLQLVANEQYSEAFNVIAMQNAAPSITGSICNHACQSACMRTHYEGPLQIRQAKLIAANNAQDSYINSLTAPPILSDKTAVIVGAGPAGVATALFLRRSGIAVTVLEKRDAPFGIVQYVIPHFRISQQAIDADFALAKTMGVEFKFGVEVGDVSALKEDYNFVVLATGAWEKAPAPFEKGSDKLLDALEFLQQSKAAECDVELGRRVGIIGGGDVAIDCARAAIRAPGVEEVALVYRRTREFMPAAPEEISLALQDGVKILELYGPAEYDGQTLLCNEMRLGDMDAGGRRSPVPTGKQIPLALDAVICATGAQVNTELFTALGLDADKRGRPVLSAMNESSVGGVYVAGDCKVGGSTVVAAIADAQRIAIDICTKSGLTSGFTSPPPALNADELYNRKGILKASTHEHTDALRCIGCSTVCEVCCDVCPNRANIQLAVPNFSCLTQIVHVDALCNECGNCAVFCPRTGKPYVNKLTVFALREDMDATENTGFARKGKNEWYIRTADGEILQGELSGMDIPAEMMAVITAFEQQYPHLI